MTEHFVSSDLQHLLREHERRIYDLERRGQSNGPLLNADDAISTAFVGGASFFHSSGAFQSSEWSFETAVIMSCFYFAAYNFYNDFAGDTGTMQGTISTAIDGVSSGVDGSPFLEAVTPGSPTEYNAQMFSTGVVEIGAGAHTVEVTTSTGGFGTGQLDLVLAPTLLLTVVDLGG